VSAPHDVAAVAARAAMRRAIALAELGFGSTSPNPIVGCVLVDQGGSVVGEGYHVRAGDPHAEVIALWDAGGRASGATAFITLEPCRHTGRTPPCTQALIDAGVSRVVFAVADPDPVAGHGADDLRAAGVLVDEGLLADEAARSNAAWLHHARTGRPFVTWKYAATLDGRVAAADGTSRWITGEAARHDVHLLRARSDAIVVGTGTVLADDPRLFAQMATMPLPPCDLPALKARLYDEHHIEIPTTHWGEVPCLRISVQGYNTRSDVERLLSAVGKLLPSVTTGR